MRERFEDLGLETSAAQQLGMWLAQRRDTVALGLRLEKVPRRGTADAWRVVRTDL